MQTTNSNLNGLPSVQHAICSYCSQLPATSFQRALPEGFRVPDLATGSWELETGHCLCPRGASPIAVRRQTLTTGC
jgi:hypothetical protein